MDLHYDNARAAQGALAARPDFNEYPMWSPNNHGRAGTTIDLFLIHTQEGDGNADSLARYCQNPAPGGDPRKAVSYHYTVSMDVNDKGVTVVDVVDTDLASWSVLSANSRSINLCFAGSWVSWSRDEWLKKAGRAIDVAAYLAVQDCKKYGIDIGVIAPPYNSGPPGISDHRYVTKWLNDGTHTDVGDNFPWDVFETAVLKYSGQKPAPAPAQALDYDKETWDQLRLQWNMLGGLTLVEAVAQIRDKVCGTDDANKPGAR
ncbi:N-acetylmuramoyl-L-alanine amidase [Mycobacterium sp.]|uniref:N-acetylmuramoyl-L-alanine amidase n=1 Tax=Mycobacterium sp. TaxID=1785 RepID=UPI003BA858C8